MNLPIAYDVTRLFLGPLSQTPRGIDRVDLLLARHFFSKKRDVVFGILPTPWGIRTLDAERVRRGLDHIEALWSEDIHSEDDQLWRWLRGHLAGEASLSPSIISRKSLIRARRLLSLVTTAGFSFGESARNALPRGTAYVHVGQISLAVPMFFRWLQHRKDITSVFMLHDVIPLATPEFVSAASSRHHATMVASAAKHATGVLVTSGYALASVRDALAKYGRGDIPMMARPLPVADVFDQCASPDPALKGIPYFVICGSIEPRKNHLLLYEVWERLARRLGAKAPHLVMVGALGWQSDKIVERYRNSEATKGLIHTVSGLSTPALKQLMVGSIGLLMPSFAEGFGLPVVEAAQLGVPVIASDIPAHCEIATSGTLLLGPTDAAAWESAIVSWCDDRARPSLRPRPAELAQRERQEYCTAVELFIAACAQRVRNDGERGYTAVQEFSGQG